MNFLKMAKLKSKSSKKSSTSQTRIRPSTVLIAKDAHIQYRLGDNDVLHGRGNGIAMLTGNKNYRKIIWHFKDRYAEMPRNDKGQVAQEVLDHLHVLGGRMVTQLVDGKYAEVQERAALEKICQALREKKHRDPFRTDAQIRKSKQRTSGNGIDEECGEDNADEYSKSTQSGNDSEPKAKKAKETCRVTPRAKRRAKSAAIEDARQGTKDGKFGTEAFRFAKTLKNSNSKSVSVSGTAPGKASKSALKRNKSPHQGNKRRVKAKTLSDEVPAEKTNPTAVPSNQAIKSSFCLNKADIASKLFAPDDWKSSAPVKEPATEGSHWILSNGTFEDMQDGDVFDLAFNALSYQPSLTLQQSAGFQVIGTEEDSGAGNNVHQQDSDMMMSPMLTLASVEPAQDDMDLLFADLPLHLTAFSGGMYSQAVDGDDFALDGPASLFPVDLAPPLASFLQPKVSFAMPPPGPIQKACKTATMPSKTLSSAFIASKRCDGYHDSPQTIFDTHKLDQRPPTLFSDHSLFLEDQFETSEVDMASAGANGLTFENWGGQNQASSGGHHLYTGRKSTSSLI